MLSSNPKIKYYRVKSKSASTAQLSRSSIGDAHNKALSAARRFVIRGVHSVSETKEYLRKKGIPDREADRFIADAQLRNQLHDPSSVRLWAEHYARKQYSWFAIRDKLFNKGFSIQHVEHLGSSLNLSVSDEARVRNLITHFCKANSRRKSMRIMAGIVDMDMRSRSRLIRRLTTRGFDSELINKLIDELIGEAL